MKHVATLACVLAASVMPTATAQTTENANSKAYAISVKGDAVPNGLEKIAYPRQAAKRSRNGACDLVVKTNLGGEIHAVAVTACTDVMFEREARKLEKSPRSLTGTGDLKPLRIEWEID